MNFLCQLTPEETLSDREQPLREYYSLLMRINWPWPGSGLSHSSSRANSYYRALISLPVKMRT